MKVYLLFLLSLTSLFSASLEHLIINNQDFSMVKEEYDVYDSKGEAMKLYREERNKNLTFILHLTLDDVTGDCSSKSLQKGSYRIEGSTITLYSLWTRRGRAYELPYGARIQKYRAESNGSVEFIGGTVYIEETKRNHDNDSGMEYLFIAPKNEKERTSLKAYVKGVESYYRARFVFDEEAKILIAEVNKNLLNPKKKGWKKLNLKNEK